MVRILIQQLEKYAEQNNIPIMEEEGIKFLTDYIKENKIKSILEIGTAIGYSAIKMALADEDIIVTTIERDEIRYNEAIKNVDAFKLTERINVLLADAFNIDITAKFDLIFIDAAKSQYTKFFEIFKHNLNNHGVIVSDNLNFHGLTQNNEAITSRSLRQMIRKLNDYVEFLKNNEEFDTTFYNIGDGVGISIKKDQ